MEKELSEDDGGLNTVLISTSPRILLIFFEIPLLLRVYTTDLLGWLQGKLDHVTCMDNTLRQLLSHPNDRSYSSTKTIGCCVLNTMEGLPQCVLWGNWIMSHMWTAPSNNYFPILRTVFIYKNDLMLCTQYHENTVPVFTSGNWIMVVD